MLPNGGISFFGQQLNIEYLNGSRGIIQKGSELRQFEMIAHSQNGNASYYMGVANRDTLYNGVTLYI